VVLDADDNVAEFLTANLFLTKDGVAITPVHNGCFLNGITRQRVIQLLRDDGIKVEERTVKPQELDTADEIFSTGNYGKVMQVTRYENRDMQPGPIGRRARELYWQFAAKNPA
jgi:branched-chain amino acid aminotransferase